MFTKLINLSEEDFLVAYDYVCENFYSGDRPEIDKSKLCILHNFPKKVFKIFTVIIPYIKGWIKFIDNKRRYTEEHPKIMFDKIFIERIFEFLNIDKKYIFDDFEIIKVSKKQVLKDVRNGDILLKFYLKLIPFTERNEIKSDIDLVNRILSDLAAYLKMTKTQLIPLLK